MTLRDTLEFVHINDDPEIDPMALPEVETDETDEEDIEEIGL